MKIEDVPERWEVVGSTEHFKGYVVRVRTDQVRMPDGEGADAELVTVTRDVVGHPGAVGIVALDDQDRVLLIRQYRHPVGYLLWELPAGLRDKAGEPTWTNAERELAEEAGYRAGTWQLLLDYISSPGMTDERIRVFLARDLTPIPDGELDFDRVHEEADMPLEWVPLDEAVRHVLNGDIHNGLAVIGILAAHAARASGFAELRPADAPEF
jgi:8-oxo-dGTP pyrophosphatase MutT (NUDIX family)